MFPPDTYTNRAAPDPVLDAATVLRMVRRHVAGAAEVTGIDESGGEARVYLIDDGLVLKTQRPQQVRARTSLAKEVAFLDALGAAAEVAVPRVLGYGHEASGGGEIEYTVMSRMPGVAASRVAVEGEARTALLEAVGRLLRRIHALPQARFFGDARFPGPRDAAAFEAALRAGFARAVAGIERAPGSWTLDEPPGALAERAMSVARPEVMLVALHSNPGPQHVFVEPATLRLSGLIDFGDAYIAQPGFDVRWPRVADREALLAGYTQEAAVSEAFMADWYASMLLAEMATVATRPERREGALRLIEWIARRL